MTFDTTSKAEKIQQEYAEASQEAGGEDDKSRYSFQVDMFFGSGDDEKEAKPLLNNTQWNIVLAIMNIFFGIMIIIAMGAREMEITVIVVILIGVVMTFTSSASLMWFSTMHMEPEAFVTSVNEYVEGKMNSDEKFKAYMKQGWLVNENRFVPDKDRYIDETIREVLKTEGLNDQENLDVVDPDDAGGDVGLESQLSISRDRLQAEVEMVKMDKADETPPPAYPKSSKRDGVVEKSVGGAEVSDSEEPIEGDFISASKRSVSDQGPPSAAPVNSLMSDENSKQTKIKVDMNPSRLPKTRMIQKQDEQQLTPKPILKTSQKEKFTNKDSAEKLRSKTVSFGEPSALYSNPEERAEFNSFKHTRLDSDSEADEEEKDVAPPEFYDDLFSPSGLYRFRKYKDSIKSKYPNGYDLANLQEQDLEGMIDKKLARRRIIEKAKEYIKKHKESQAEETDNEDDYANFGIDLGIQAPPGADSDDESIIEGDDPSQAGNNWGMG